MNVKQYSNYTIATFLVASVVIHSYFLWQQKNESYAVINGESPMSISLNSSEQYKNKQNITKQKVSKTNQEYPVINKKRHLSIIKITNKISGPSEKPVIKNMPVETRSAPTSTNETSLFSEEKIQKGIRNLFQANFYYPSIARRNQWQGKLEVSLRIMPDGKLANIQIVKTSGFSILDNAAIDTLRTANILPLAKKWLNGKHFDMILPIEYRLVDS